MMRRPASIALLALLLCSACTAPPPAPGTPEPRRDWVVGDAAAAGFDADALERLAAGIEAGDFPNTHALLIEHAGRLVFERYFPGSDKRWGDAITERLIGPDSLHDVRSISKSVTSALLGIALAERFETAVDRPVAEYLPQLEQEAERRAITLHHVLTMTPGLAWNEMTVPYTDPKNDEIRLYRAGDPARHVMSRPVVHEPGSTWYYSGGTTQLLASVITELTGQRLDDFARDRLFGRLGITDFEWLGPGEWTPDNPAAMSGLRLTARDLAKIGSVYLHDGRWQGRQVVPEAWVSRSVLRHVDDTGDYGGGGVWGTGISGGSETCGPACASCPLWGTAINASTSFAMNGSWSRCLAADTTSRPPSVSESWSGSSRLGSGGADDDGEPDRPLPFLASASAATPMRSRSSAIVSACLAALLSSTAQAQQTAQRDALPRFDASDCPFDKARIDVKGLRCGYLTVPENRQKDDGRTLRLAVAIAEPPGATDDPVVLLPGGPGGGPLPRWIAGIRQWIPSDRTLVVFDPRGTGHSGPIMCPELNETQNAIAALDLSIEEERLLRRGADLACRDVLLRQGIDLGAYNSTTVALDLIDLRRALGFAQWNLMSASYGVPFARAAMRLDPEGIRSAVLAIGNPPDLTDLLRRDVPFRARAMGRVFEGCAAEAACRAMYPDLEAAFYRVSASLRAEPLTVPVDPERFRSPTFTVNSQDYFAMISGLLPWESDVPHIPALIRAFDGRDVDVLRKVVERHYGGLSSNWSFGMANSVMCYDADTPQSRAEWQEAAAPYAPELAEIVDWLQPCEDWHDERASEEERRPHRSTIPALVISGEFDPTSHPVVGEEQLRWLPNGYHVVIPGMGHMPTARSAACWGSLIEQFVAEPSRRPDESCTEELPQVRIGPELPAWAQPGL